MYKIRFKLYISETLIVFETNKSTLLCAADENSINCYSNLLIVTKIPNINTI